MKFTINLTWNTDAEAESVAAALVVAEQLARDLTRTSLGDQLYAGEAAVDSLEWVDEHGRPCLITMTAGAAPGGFVDCAKVERDRRQPPPPADGLPADPLQLRPVPIQVCSECGQYQTTMPSGVCGVCQRKV